MKHVWFILAILLGLTLQAVPAAAGLTYTLNCSDKTCAGASGNNNFGTVELHAGATGHVIVTVTLAAGETFANLSSGYAILWDIGGSPNITIALASGNSANDFAVQNSGTPSMAGHYLAPPFGNNSNNCSGGNATSCFDYAIARKNISGTDSTLVFDVTSSSGLVLTDFVGTTLGGNPGFTFAAMINVGGSAQYVASNGTPVPEPPTWSVSAAGLMGLAVLAMLRRRRTMKAD